MKPVIDSSGIGALLGNAETQKGPPGEVIPALLAAIRKHLGMDAAFLAEFIDGRRVFRYVDSAVDGAPRAGESDALEASYCKLVAEERLPELISDASSVAAPGARVGRMAVGAQLCIPIVLSDGRTYGTFCSFSRTPDASLGERDVAMMGVFAGLAAQALERQRAAERSAQEVRKRITHVLKLGKVYSVYQPMYALDDKSIAGFECLSRFDAEPKQGPDFWFAEAASVGLGSELELGAIRRALPALDKLPQAMHLSFNVSPQLLLDGRLERELDARLGKRVVIEITEHETVKEYERLVSALEPLRRLGVRVAIDDAGAGYSTFRH